jgi:hypothetical protein
MKRVAQKIGIAVLKNTISFGKESPASSKESRLRGPGLLGWNKCLNREIR